jgi:hypothetical protein
LKALEEQEATRKIEIEEANQDPKERVVSQETRDRVAETFKRI